MTILQLGLLPPLGIPLFCLDRKYPTLTSLPIRNIFTVGPQIFATNILSTILKVVGQQCFVNSICGESAKDKCISFKSITRTEQAQLVS